MLTERKIKIKRYTFLSLSLMIAVIIFWFSHQTATESSDDSRGVIWFVMNLIPYFAHMTVQARLDIIDMIHTFVRKMAHFSIYAVLGVFVINYILTYTVTRKKAFFLSAASCFFYACTDEIHQLFIQGRSGEIRDVFIDLCGSVTGICLVLLVLYIFKVRRARR